MTAVALSSPISHGRYIINRWDAAAGLPQNRVDSIAQSAEGLIWVNTADGALGTFDGLRWNRPAPTLASRLAPGFLLSHPDDRLLLVSRQGNAIAIGKVQETQSLFKFSGPVDAVAETRDGRLWLASRSELSFWDGSSVKPAQSPVPLGEIHALLATPDGDLWIGHGEGLAVLRRNRMERVVLPVPGPVTSLAELATGSVLAVSAHKQVFEIAGNKVIPTAWGARLRAAASGAEIYALRQDRHGNLWLNLGEDGIALVNGSRVSLFGAGDGLPQLRAAPGDDRGYWIWEDRDGGLWFGLCYGGILSLKLSPFETYGAPDGMPDEFLWTVLEDRRGTVWAASESGLLTLTNGKWSALSAALKLPRTRARGLLEAHDGTVWASVGETIFQLRAGKVTSKVPIGFGVFAMAEDNAGRIWISGRKVGYLEGRRHEFHAVEGVCEPARAIRFATDGALWIACGKGGIAIVRDGAVETLPMEPWRVESFYQDPRGVMWAGTGSNGLLRIDHGKVFRFQTREQRGPDDVHSIVEDRRGYLWLSSNSGLRRVSRQQLDEVAQGSRDRAWFQHFDERAGLRDREFQGGNVPAGSLAADGSILMPSRAGLVRVDPTFDYAWNPHFKPVLSGIEIAGEPAEPGSNGELRFQSTHRRLAVRFAVPAVSSPHTVQYQLAGFDQSWQPVQPAEPVSYTNLPPGRYHFMVRVAPFGGEPAPPARLVTLDVQPALLQSGWFLAALALALAGAGALLASLRSRHIRRQKQLLEHEVAQRTAQLAQEIAGRAEIERQLIQAQKMESVDRLAGGVAHDFNNLLTVIFANLELARLSETLDQQQSAHLEEIEHATRRAADLTRQLLTFARRQVVEPKIVDVNQVTTQLARILRRLVGENVELVIILAPDLPPVRVDPGQFEQVLVNLVINARDAMPQGGKVTIETRRDEDAILLSVADNGVGMDEQTASRVFEPFFTTKKARGGTGLGLAICYGIVNQAGGEIRVWSQPGNGARFEIRLPAAEGALNEDAAPAPSVEELQGHESVLVVEDEERVRELAAQTLRANGYRVVAAANGDEALRALAAHDWDIDLVVADLIMPLVGGRELARRVAARSPHTRILYVSGYTEDSTFERHLAETGHAFLAKPFTLIELARKVRETLDRAAVRREAARAASNVR